MALVQENSGTTGTTTPATVDATLSTGTTAGNTLLLIVSSDSTVSTPSGFTLDRSQVNNNGHYVFRKATAAGETSWTITPTAAASTCWWVREESGLLSSPVDQVASTGASAQATTRSTGTTPTTTQADEFLLATIGTSKNFSEAAIPTLSGWTNSFIEIADGGTTKTTGTNVGLGVATREVTATGAYETTATLSVAASSTGIIVTYKRTSGANATATPATIAVVAALPAATANTSTGSTVSPAVIPVVVAVKTFVVEQDWTADPATTATTAALPAATVQAGSGATATPAVIPLIGALPAATLSAGATPTPATIPLIAALPAATASNGITATPATIAVVAALPAATVQTGATATPATIAVITAANTPTLSAGSTVAPAVVALIVSLPGATVTTPPTVTWRWADHSDRGIPADFAASTATRWENA